MKQIHAPLLLPPSAMEADETIVSQILLDLKTLMSLSESLSNFNWTRRKRRSCLNPPPALLPAPPPSVHEIKNTSPAADRTTSSPDTPLFFSPRDSDHKAHHSSKKRTRDEYIGMIHELNQRKDLLRGEIETVKNYYRKLKAFNSNLKAVKHEVLNSCARKEESQMNLGKELPQHYRMNIVRHHPPSIGDPTMQRFPCPFGPITNGVELVNHFGRLGIDLNMPAEEVDRSQPLDMVADRRARFAEARRKRRGMIKIKAMKKNGCGLRLKLPENR